MSAFRSAVVDFRSRMGDRGWWMREDRQAAAIKALGSAYLSGADPRDATTLEATMMEYERRRVYMKREPRP